MNIFENTIFDKFKTRDVGHPQADTVSQNPDVHRLPRNLAAAVEATDMTRPEIEPVEKQAMEHMPSAPAETPVRAERTLTAAARAAGMMNKTEDDQDTGRSEGEGESRGGHSQVRPTSYSDSNAIAGVSGVMGLAGGQADESPDRHPTPSVAPAPTPDEDPLDALRRALDAPEPERPAAPSQSANLPRSLGEAAARMASTPTPSEDPLDALHRALDAPDANEPVPRPEISRARRMRP